MNELRKIAYIKLIQSLLSCPSGKEVGVLSAHPELIDEGLVEMMRTTAEMTTKKGQRNAGWLQDFAGKIKIVNYSLPRLQTQLAADTLWQQGFQQYQQNQYPRAFRSLQQCLALYQAIGDKAGIASSWGVLGDIERNRGNWNEAERLYRQSLELSTELGDRKEMAAVSGVLGDIER
ncbi:tetratricopeptide repeat protein, partial [Laspinema sp. D1]|nr:tetratricopeptide repeat protein [Laspinema sp. D2a]